MARKKKCTTVVETDNVLYIFAFNNKNVVQLRWNQF